MTTETSTEQLLFRETNIAFVESTASVSAVRRLWDEGRTFDREWWSQAIELGWTSLLVPEELGGGSASGEGVTDLVSLVELLGSQAAPGPLNAVSVVLAGLAEAPPGQCVADAIEHIMAGEKIATWAVAAPGPAWELVKPAIQATAAAGGWQLHGLAGPVEFATEADLFLVTAQEGDGLIQLLVDAQNPQIRIESTSSVDMVRGYGTVRFDGVHVTQDAIVGTPETTLRTVERQAQLATLLQVAETVGAVSKVFDFTVQWGFDRYSFGRPLASYQALKHRYADMKLWLEASRATLGAATAAVQARTSDASHLVSVAKSYVGERGVQIIQDCVQLHGGIGVTMEHDLHIYLRRAMVDRQLYGTPRDHRELIARHIGL